MNVNIVWSPGHESRENSASSIKTLTSDDLGDPFGGVNANFDTDDSRAKQCSIYSHFILNHS